VTTKSLPVEATQRRIKTPQTYESIAWKWMRYSAVLLIPLVWIHVLLQDVLIGVHRINIDFVALRWAMLGWRVFDVLLLSFAFAHGMNGLRQVLDDYIHQDGIRRLVSWLLLFIWAAITAIGAVAIIGGVRK
jgi:succinate dehydrogenase / fumarate reductase membrane anchor subunit